MKLQIASLFLAALSHGTVADPRGSGGAGTRGVRQRRTMKENMGDMDKESDSGSVVSSAVEGASSIGDNGIVVSASGLQEAHACERNPQTAIDYVTQYGKPEMGDEGCLADPVNGCGGGCCRYSVYFICDTDNTDPYAQCVCNDLTVDPLAFVDPASASAGNATASNVTTPAGPTDPPLTAEQLAEEFPGILAAIEAQEGAIAAEGDNDDDDDDEKGDKDRDLFD